MEFVVELVLEFVLELVLEFVLKFVTKALEHREDLILSDYKTMLQEIVQKKPEEKLSYVLVEESGPDHNKRFVVEVHLNSNVISTGCGGSKKSAEQAAAREALRLMGQ